jgi:hypothetical protein
VKKRLLTCTSRTGLWPYEKLRLAEIELKLVSERIEKLKRRVTISYSCRLTLVVALGWSKTDFFCFSIGERSAERHGQLCRTLKRLTVEEGLKTQAESFADVKACKGKLRI